MSTITLPFPPSSLSGHAGGHWRAKAEVTRKHRNWARLATMDAKARVRAAEARHDDRALGRARMELMAAQHERLRLGQ